MAQLERMGHYEEALFYRRSTMDMVLAVHAAWSGAPYDPEMDKTHFETRTDRRYWNIVNAEKRPIAELLAKAKLSAEQSDRLDERVRVYVEDHLSPEFDEMGNFYFRRRAWIFERMGMFYDAHFRRRLTGYYCIRVCQPYYATMALELERKGQSELAEAYRAKADFFARQAELEFRRSNGDRLISQDRKGDIRQQLNRTQVLDALKKALRSPQADARLAAVLNLADLGEFDAIVSAAKDDDTTVRRELARIFADSRHVAGLNAMSDDTDASVKATVAAALAPHPAITAGLKWGLAGSYFSDPAQDQPVVRKILAGPEIGLNGNERFAPKLKPFWPGEHLAPANAEGQFMVRLTGKIFIPADGAYRFYVKTEGDNRATVKLAGNTVISARNDKLLLYSTQSNYGQAESLTRIDFSLPVELRRGLVELKIEYKGAQVKLKHGPAGLRLNWSGPGFVMEPVPAFACFHGD